MNVAVARIRTRFSASTTVHSALSNLRPLWTILASAMRATLWLAVVTDVHISRHAELRSEVVFTRQAAPARSIGQGREHSAMDCAVIEAPDIVGERHR